MEPITASDNLPKPFVRVHEFMRQRAFPFEAVPENARINAFQEADRMMHSKNANALIQAQQPEWVPIGPFKVGGRIKSVVPHPTKNGWVYVGAAAGGIWRTTDSGNNWAPIFDYENGIAFGSIAIDPNHPDTMYAGTGEAVSSAGGGLGGTPIYLGAGLFKSTDAGTTWNLIGLRNVGTFSKVFVHPKNSNFIVAGGCYKGQGFYKSTDAGATWVKTFDKNVTDVTIDPNDENRIYIGVTSEGVYFSSNAGDTWELRSTGLDAGIGRVSVQLAPSNPLSLYALMDINNIGTIYKSTNGGTSWSRVYNGQDAFFNSQGWYDNYICVHPTNENIVLAGGIDIWRTSNGGTNWMNVTNGYSGGNVHVDQHHAAFNPLNPNQVYAGNDGGMYKSTNTGQAWDEINNNLQVTQFYSLAVDNSKVNRNFGGTQDNGTLGNLNPDIWSGILGGDGFRTIVDYDNPNIFYGESQYGSMRRVNLSTMTGKSIETGIPGSDPGPWDSPFIMDPQNNYVLYHGRHALYGSYNNGDSWSAITGIKANFFSSIAVSHVNDLVIWAGTQVGELFVCQDGADRGNDSWEEVSTNGLVNRYITDIETSYENDGTAFVTFSGYGAGHVFKTTDFGKNWENIGKILPDAPCNAIAIHPENENILFVATDVGVFATYNGGNTWLPYGRGLPRSPVLDLSFHLNRVVLPDWTLRAATHGRSMWEVTVPADMVTDMAITSPAGGEVYVGTSSAVISWYGFTQAVKIEFSTNDGADWVQIASNVVGNYLRWKVPSIDAMLCRIRVSTTENSLVSKSFSINKLQKGSVLASSGVKYVPYGITYDGINGLWSTDFGGNKLYKLNGETFAIEKSITLPGDSLFSDLTLDRQNGTLYIHKMNSTAGNGGKILVLDTLGNLIRSFNSPSKSYPIGLELVDGNLIACDRDGTRQMYKISPVDGTLISQNTNPYNKTYGPRGICYDGTQYLYQVCTYFPGGGSLTEALAMKIDKANLGTSVETMTLESNTGGMINARGIDVDPRDNNFWISDYNGNLYKIAGFNTLVSGFTALITSGKVPLNVQFSDNSVGNITSRFWNFGDGGTSTEKNPMHTYVSTGKFTVTLTVSDAIKGDTTIKQNYIFVYDDKPSAAFAAQPLSGVRPLEVQFTDNSTGNISSWSWNFGDGSTSTEKNPLHIYNTPGLFTVTLLVSDGTNENTKINTNYISVYDNNLSAAFSADPLSGVVPLNVQFTDNSNGDVTSWAWDFGDGGTSTEKNPIHNYQDTGTYSVKLQIKNLSDSAEITKTNYITVYSANVLRADFSAEPKNGLVPLSVQFTNISTGNPTSWLWNFGNGETSSEQNPTHIYQDTGKYSVSLQIKNQTDSTEITKSDYINVYPANFLSSDFSAEPLEGKIPLSVQFTNLSIGNPTSWLWKFGDDSTSSEQNPVHVYNTSNIYTVELTISNGINLSTISKKDYISANPPSGVDDNGTEEKRTLDVRIFPNPMVEFSIVSFKSLIDNAQVKVLINDVLGRSMGTYFDGIMNKAETHYFQIKAGMLTSGVYYVTVFVNGRQVELKQLVVTQ